MSFILLGILNSQVPPSGAGSFDLLETTVLGSNTASVTFSSLGSYSDYKHLQLRIVARSTNADLTRTARMQFNGVTTSSYAHHYLRGTGSTGVSSAAITGVTSMDLGAIYAANATANAFGALVVDILDFSSSSKNTTIRTLGGNEQSSQPEISLRSGLFNNTAAITSITLTTVSNYASGSRFSLYGIK